MCREETWPELAARVTRMGAYRRRMHGVKKNLSASDLQDQMLFC